MRIVIDLQGAQGSNRTRGIGRYSLALAQAMARNPAGHEIVVALNGSLEDTVGPLRDAFEALVAPENVCVWPGLRDVSAISEQNDWRRGASERMREAFIASLRPDAVCITSVFEGFGDDAVTSIGTFTNAVPTAMVLYDLIPLIRRDLYLQSPAVERWFENKLGHVRRADVCLAISESSRREGMGLLGLPEQQVINISAAADPRFRPMHLSDGAVRVLCQRLGLRLPFIMYTGGIDPRKNIEGLIRAYALLPGDLRGAHQLAIVCAVQPADKVRLSKLAATCGLAPGEFAMTGFLSDADLVALYNLCSFFVFPSLHEGFGLPALEAMACGAAVIGSAGSSVPEVIGREDALFDAKDDRAIAAAMQRVLVDATFRRELKVGAVQRAQSFSWDRTARRAIDALERLQQARGATVVPMARSRPRLAYVSPLPPERSGIADYSAELLPALTRHYDIDVIVTQSDVSSPGVTANCEIRSAEWFDENARRYDRILYHFGNSHFHQHMFGLLERHPGMVCLHDFFLSGALFHMECAGAPHCWSRALYHSHGYPALAERAATPDHAAVLDKYPANRSVLENALGVIVHSEFSRALATRWYGPEAAREWIVVPQVRGPEIAIDRAEARSRLGLREADFIVCSFGIVAKTKLNHRLLAAWSASELARDDNCRLVFVGDHYGSDYGSRLERTIARLPTPGNVCITGFVSDHDYRLWLSAADVAVQLRTQSRGETSRAVLDCMSFGLPTIVNDHGSMRETAAAVVLPDAFSEADLVQSLEQMRGNAGLRSDTARTARQRIAERHNPRHVAEQFFAAIETVYRAETVGRSGLVASLVGLPNGPDHEADWARAAQAVSQCVPRRLPVRQVLLDISGLVAGDERTEALDCMRATLRQLLANQPADVRMEPIYHADSTCRYARQFTSRLLGLPGHALADDRVEYFAQDTYVELFPLRPSLPAVKSFLSRFTACGGQIRALSELSGTASPERNVVVSRPRRQHQLHEPGTTAPRTTEALASSCLGGLNQYRSWRATAPGSV